MKIETATQDDFENWLDLARQVEHLFGPMVDEESFRKAQDRVVTEPTPAGVPTILMVRPHWWP